MAAATSRTSRLRKVSSYSVNAEAVRGQRTGSGDIIDVGGRSPAIWVAHNADGSITISCR